MTTLLAAVGFAGCGEDAAPRPGGPGGEPPSPYGPDGTLRPGLPAAKRRPNVLFVVVEQLRADAAASPASNPLFGGASGNDVDFEQAVTPSPEAGAAIASLLTARLPSRHRVSHLDPVPRLDPGFVTLPEVLRAQGYATRAFVASDRLRKSAALWQGCDVAPEKVDLTHAAAALKRWRGSLDPATPWLAVFVVDDLTPPHLSEAYFEGPAPSAEVRVDVMSEVAEAWFTHRPDFDDVRRRANAMYGPDRYGAWFAGLKRFLWAPSASGFDVRSAPLTGVVQQAYADEVHRLTRFMGYLENWGRSPGESIRVFTSTGGTAFGEHGVLGAGRQLYDEQLRIPLVLDGITPHGHVKDCVSLVDLLPTMLDVLGLPPLPGIDGVSLLPALRGEAHRPPVISEEHQDGENTGDPSVKATLVSVRSPKWKYIVRFDLRAGTVVEEAYDLTNDSAEKKNLANDRGTVEGVAFDAEMCAAIERVRDGLWGQVKGANDTFQTIYGQGARVTTGRPKPCGK